MLQQIADRLFASWKTTLIGVAVFAFLVYLGHSGAVPWKELWVWMGAAGAILFIREPSIAKKRKRQELRAQGVPVKEPPPKPPPTPGT